LIYDLKDNSGNLPTTLYTDSNRLKQIIINLLSNAIKYTYEGHVKLYGHVDRKKKHLRIIIEDTGVGMTRSQVKNLFRNFTKIMDHRELNSEGVGLGLTISRNIAQALGGDIEVQSRVGEGSNFILLLPL